MTMRISILSLSLLFVVAAAARAEQNSLNPRDLDKQLFDLLKEVHNQGADLYNAGDAAGCYRLFQGALKTARGVLTHRPAEQKLIDDLLADADKRGSVTQRAFALHESIEKVRLRLRAPGAGGVKEPEKLTVPPRESSAGTKPPAESAPPKETMPQKRSAEKKPAADPAPIPDKKPLLKELPLPPSDGVSGRVFSSGRPIASAEITFVSRGAVDIRVFETMTDADGHYEIAKVAPGKYTVLLTERKNKRSLSDRYATSTTSTLIVDVQPDNARNHGDTVDFLLQ